MGSSPSRPAPVAPKPPESKPRQKPPHEWGVAEVYHWLMSFGEKKLAAHFANAGIDGESLLALNSEELFELGVTSKVARKNFLKRLDALQVNYLHALPSDAPLSEPPEGEVCSWSKSDVGIWLCSIGFKQHVRAFCKLVDGPMLLQLEREDLADLGMRSTVQQKFLLTQRRKLSGAGETKGFAEHSAGPKGEGHSDTRGSTLVTEAPGSLPVTPTTQITVKPRTPKIESSTLSVPVMVMNGNITSPAELVTMPYDSTLKQARQATLQTVPGLPANWSFAVIRKGSVTAERVAPEKEEFIRVLDLKPRLVVIPENGGTQIMPARQIYSQQSHAPQILMLDQSPSFTQQTHTHTPHTLQLTHPSNGGTPRAVEIRQNVSKLHSAPVTRATSAGSNGQHGYGAQVFEQHLGSAFQRMQTASLAPSFSQESSTAPHPAYGGAQQTQLAAKAQDAGLPNTFPSQQAVPYQPSQLALPSEPQQQVALPQAFQPAIPPLPQQPYAPPQPQPQPAPPQPNQQAAPPQLQSQPAPSQPNQQPAPPQPQPQPTPAQPNQQPAPPQSQPQPAPPPPNQQPAPPQPQPQPAPPQSQHQAVPPQLQQQSAPPEPQPQPAPPQPNQEPAPPQPHPQPAPPQPNQQPAPPQPQQQATGLQLSQQTPVPHPNSQNALMEPSQEADLSQHSQMQASDVAAAYHQSQQHLVSGHTGHLETPPTAGASQSLELAVAAPSQLTHAAIVEAYSVVPKAGAI